MIRIYGYITILAFYFIIFIVSRKEDAASFQRQEKKKSWPGESLFLKAAAWYIRKRKRRQNQDVQNRLGKNLRLLHPEIPEKYQVKEFYVRQYALAAAVFFIGNLLCLCTALSARTGGLLQEGGYLDRKPYGQGGTDITLAAQIEGEEEKTILYTVEEQKYRPEEAAALFKEASAKLPEAILGENSGLECITKNLNLVTSMEGYPFTISWESGSYSLLHTDGTVCNEELEKAQSVMLKARFRYGESEFEEVFPVQIYPAVYTKDEMLMQSILDALEKQSRESESQSRMMLPKEAGGREIIWREVIEDSSGTFFLVMCIAAALVFFSKKKEVEENLEKRKRELLLDYPEIVNKLTLYMGAGMTIRNAFLKMGEDYKKQKVSGTKRYVYEEISLLCHELQSGVSETEAYAHLGKRCQLQPYMKLSALLSQNLRKGSNDLLMMLRQETASAFEQRKNAAKKAGEEAGTKLLLPMMMMLCIVMVLIMIPAYFSFS
ncbi:MAG: type II secretion system F family protein [Clostridium sp.]|nr:type II secretion system F family protein [Clostridium sp.]